MEVLTLYQQQIKAGADQKKGKFLNMSSISTTTYIVFSIVVFFLINVKLTSINSN